MLWGSEEDAITRSEDIRGCSSELLSFGLEFEQSKVFTIEVVGSGDGLTVLS
jgi:hypothetical protein